MNKPTTEELITKYMERGTLSREEVQSAAMDCLDFLMRVQDAGWFVGVRCPPLRKWHPVEVLVPGLSTEVVPK